MRLTVFLLIFTFCLTGCTNPMFRKNDPMEAKPAPETAKVTELAEGEDTTSDETTTARPSEVASDKNQKLAEAPLVHVGESETITEDTVWSGRVSIRGAVTVAPQATLTITPGSVVEFSSSSQSDDAGVLLVHGRLVAQGTYEQPIRFTTDIDKTGAAAWHGIVFLGSEKKNILEYCRIEAAETGVDASYSTLTIKNSGFSGCRTALSALDCLLYMSGSTVKGCDVGISLQESEVEITGGELASNRAGIVARRTSVYMSGAKLSGNTGEAFTAEQSNLKIAGNGFTGNGSGLGLSSSEGLVSGNLIAENGTYGISLHGSRIKVVSNDISRNREVGIRVADGKALAWGNSIASNGRYDLYNAGPEDFRAIGNWWGKGGAPGSPGTIYDRRTNPGSGKVLYFPVLKTKPAIVP